MIAMAKLRSWRNAVAGFGVLVVGTGIWLGWHGLAPAAPPDQPGAAQPLDPAPASTVLIFVSGAVAHPGLYRLSPDARVADALAAAGGLAGGADPGRLPNLASRVHDGKQLNVPFLRGGGRSTGGTVAAKLDVNSASLDELATVPGMPAGLPQAIVAYRVRFGAFASLTDLRDALGVDRTLMSELAHYLTAVAP
jgi:competence protein ComEA